MSHNSFGHLFRVTTWGESHGPAIGCVVDGCPPRIALTEADIQPWLDRRRPGQSRFTTQRQEPDEVRILSGTLDGLTTGTPIALEIQNVDQRSRDYGDIAQQFRPGHADPNTRIHAGHAGLNRRAAHPPATVAWKIARTAARLPEMSRSSVAKSGRSAAATSRRFSPAPAVAGSKRPSVVRRMICITAVYR